MTYQQALNIGSEAVGIVKCTYAMLYDENGNKLFSFQRISGQYIWEPDAEMSERLGQTVLVRRPDIPETDNVSAFYYKNVHTGGGVSMPDVPCVRATEYVPDAQLVPVYITDAAKEWINYCCPNDVVDVYDSKGKLARRFVNTSDSRIQSYIENGYTAVRHDPFERLHERLNDVVYVKPVALAWSIEKLPENNELAELKAKYEKARAILLASLPTALIP